MKFIVVDKWRIHRRVIKPTFNLRRLEKFLPIFNVQSKSLISKLDNESDTGISFNLWTYVFSHSLSSICGMYQTAFRFTNFVPLGNAKFCVPVTADPFLKTKKNLKQCFFYLFFLFYENTMVFQKILSEGLIQSKRRHLVVWK